MKELVSIVVPIYNTHLSLLERCVNSIINQTYKNVEILLIDDGSKDDFRKDYKHFIANKDKRINVVYKNNEGVSSARNLGIEMSKGKYIAFVDSDDYIVESYIEKLYEAIKKHNSDICFTSSNKIYKQTVEKQKIYVIDNKKILLKDKKISEFSPYNLDLMGTVWGKLYRKDIIGKTRFNQNIKFGEDILFNFMIFTDDLAYCYIDEYLYQYVINEQSTIRKFDLKAIKQYEETIKELEKIVKNDNSEKYNAYLLFICTFYRVIGTNYICNSNNKIKFRIKILQLRNLRFSKYFKLGIDNANLSFMRLSRRIPIILAKNNMFLLLYIIIKIRNIQTKLL